VRRRIVRVAVGVTVLAIVLFGVPLAVAAVELVHANLVNELERTALSASGQVNPTLGEGDALELPAPPGGGQLGVYGPSGHRVAGTGPVTADLAVTTALSGATRDHQSEGRVVVAVPVRDAERVVGALRVASAPGAAGIRIAQVVGAMLGGASVAVTVAWVVAWHAGRRLAAPLEQIAATSARHADGDHAARAPLTGLPETDAVASSVNTAARTVSDVLERERTFTAQASHQLRTPLTRIGWGLESALAGPDQALRPAVRAAIRDVGALDDGVTALLDLRRGAPSGAHTDLAEVLEELADSYRGVLASASRPLRVQIPPGPWDAAIAPGAARHIVQVLLENADQHGAGQVTARLRDAVGTDDTSSTIALDVIDEGQFSAAWPATMTSEGHGIGLPLASRLAADAEGRVLLGSRHPTTITVLVPRQSGHGQVR
jgi:signal transduction histidine kinase